jgi:predicted esterase
MRLKFIFTLAVVCGFSLTALHAQQTAKITSSGIGYLEYTPQNYDNNNNDYPIVIFLHGIGERGTTSTDPATLKSSVQKVANVGLAKNVKQGTQYPFILISPQLKSSYGTWPANYVMSVLNHVKKYLRVDNRRIYITGLSLGGFGTWTTLGAYPEVFAAAIPICSGGSALSKACAIASENVALWAFHGTGDKVVSYNVTTKMINAVNACTPKPSPLAKTTLFSGLGHAIWDKVYKDTNALNWMLNFTNGTVVADEPADEPTTGNSAPVVSAGGDKSIALPETQVYIQGSASDSDGSIASYKWTKTSGPSVSMGGVSIPKMRAYNLVEGSYTFRLTVKDNDGATRYNEMKLTVTSSTATNVRPVAYAGPNRSTSSSSITVNGSGTDKDGKIVSYKWIQYSGPTATLTNANSPNVTVSGMKGGSYYLKLTVTDDDGATHSDNTKIDMSGSGGGSTSPNVAPIANAGANLSISSTSVIVRGTGSDKDGDIVSYKWTQYGGPAANLTNANTANVTVSGLKGGKYYLRLTVTDDRGATDSDNMLINVSSGTAGTGDNQPNIAPVAYAGENRKVTSDVSAVRIFGSGKDKDGKIVSYKWIQYGGPEITLQNVQSSTVTVKDLEEGKYYLKLRVKDDDGAVDADNMLLVVEES